MDMGRLEKDMASDEVLRRGRKATSSPRRSVSTARRAMWWATRRDRRGRSRRAAQQDQHRSLRQGILLIGRGTANRSNLVSRYPARATASRASCIVPPARSPSAQVGNVTLRWLQRNGGTNEDQCRRRPVVWHSPLRMRATITATILVSVE